MSRLIIINSDFSFKVQDLLISFLLCLNLLVPSKLNKRVLEPWGVHLRLTVYKATGKHYHF